MTSRRQFIQAGLTMTTLPLTGFVGSLHAETSVLKLDHFVFDERYSESRDVAKAIQQVDVLKHGVIDDLTKLWYNFLQVDLTQGSSTIAGITSKETLFFLERLGWTHGLRVVYRGQHSVPVKGLINHEISGAESIVSKILNSEETSWPYDLAFSLQQCDPAIWTQTKCTVLRNSNSNIERDTELVSWLMVPIQVDSVS